MDLDDEIARAGPRQTRLTFPQHRPAAAYLKLSGRQLKRLRRTGKGPVYRRHSRFVQYHIDDLDGWSRDHAGRDFER